MIDVMVLLDRSGSMERAKADHEGGMRNFVEEQRSAPGEARFTFIQFDSHNPCEIIYDRAHFDAVTDIKLIPRGSTPLLDAVGKSLAHLEMKQAESPADATVVMIITDGLENASTEWTKDRVKSRIQALKKKGYTFVFLGANIDAFAEGGGLGIGRGTTLCFAESATMDTYQILSSNLYAGRGIAEGGDFGGVGASMTFTEDDRKRSMNGKV